MSKKNKKFMRRKLEWATAHFHYVLGHDTTNCIVTQLGRGVHQGGHDTVSSPATRPYDMTSRATTRSANA